MSFNKSHRWMVAFFVLFVVLAILVIGGFTSVFDEAGVLLFRTQADPNTPVGGSNLAFLITNLTHLGDSIVLAAISLVAVAFLYRKQGTHAAIWFLVAASGSFIITAVAKAAFGRARPDIVEHLVKATSASFPSGHALRSAVVYSLVAYLLIQWKSEISKNTVIIITLMIILMNGISRIYLGVHWPSDIVASWLIAGFWLLLTHYGYNKTHKTRDEKVS